MIGAMVSSSGDFMQNIAQSWLVWHVSRSPVAIGVVAFFDTLPRLLVGAVGGAIADRFDRRRVLMITQTLAMIQAIIYWLIVEFEIAERWGRKGALFIYFLGALLSVPTTFLFTKEFTHAVLASPVMGFFTAGVTTAFAIYFHSYFSLWLGSVKSPSVH